MSDIFSLSNVRAVITGASRGIGSAIAEEFAQRGASVVLLARTTSEIDSLAETINSNGGRAFARSLDVTDADQVAEIESWASDVLNGPVNVLINNAGIYIPNRFMDYSALEWEHIFDVNVFGAVRMTNAFLPKMIEVGDGKIINMASTAGKYGSMNQSAYNASKHALVGITRCLALETAAQGIRVNAICPGFVDTDLLTASALGEILGTDEAGIRSMIDQRTPIGRAVTVSEVAALAVYLASAGGDAMTGIALTLAGGLILI